MILEHSGLKEPFFGRKNGALALGTAVHQLTELMDRGQADRYTFHPKVEAFKPCWANVRRLVPFEIEAIEEPEYHPDLDYAGIPDRVAIWEKTRTLVEVKTGQKYPWHPLQTAPYAALAECKRRLIFYLDPTKPLGFTMEEHTDRADWQKFRAALVTTQGMKFEKENA